MNHRCPFAMRLRMVRLFLVASLLALLVSAAPQLVQAVPFVGASAATQVTDLGGGNTEYRYTITNTSDLGGPGMVAWGMPFFDDAATSFTNGEASIFAPDGWDHIFTELTPNDPNDPLWGYVAADDPKNDTYGAPGTAFDSPPYALVFYTFLSGIAPGDSLGDFGYESPFTGTNVPFIASYDNLQLTIGDPIGPVTPSFPILNANIGAFPEPSSLTLIALGVVCVSARRRHRE